MSLSNEIALLIPLLLPFVIGLLVGVVVKHGLKLLVAIAALVIVLIATGYLNLTYQDAVNKALQLLPKLINTSLTFSLKPGAFAISSVLMLPPLNMPI